MESYNGTSWSEGNDLNTGRAGGGSGGTQAVAMYAAGSTFPGETRVANVETWNGTSWTEVNDVATARSFVGSCQNAGTGITSNSIIFGGDGPPFPVGSTNLTEEFADPFEAIKTVTIS